ncbi:XrtB/PEP-CTERM-associated polysaccharide biosynthesis outer membrane protein EpsL [Massilia terrae]|uniref:Exopolysaccharide biosynthesis protein EpsL n=1 Tax=Massilia terrae TaxID=1811224 RepID=A0ABT2D112_9BURK|nr:XrtB/PEP-CTERM-associated polysaccharide biosynthesis outer membrane protein EpsL [Massilia terrae]MCS0659048.1 exopolysaccharide biosynthesis protein EpsL [Massilia terrae]
MQTSKTLALLIGALFALPALAQQDEGFHPYAGIGWGHDDNLLRVPDNLPGFDNTRSDSWKQGVAGFYYDHTWSRQRVLLQTRLARVDYDHFKQLNYTGKNLEGTWYWQLGNHLSGKLGTLFDETLAPYTDFYSDQRNLRTRRRNFFEGAWRFHPSWQAKTAFAKDSWTYELNSQRFNNRTEYASELEGDYVPANGSTIGLVYRHLNGRYPNGYPFGFLIVNNDYKQDELKARIDWLLTGTTTLQGLVGYARRDQPSFGGTTSGANGRVSLLYTPRGKVTYTASVWQDFAPLESTVVSTTLNKGVSLGATWSASAKIKVDALATYERRSYDVRAGSALQGASNLRDALRTASLNAVWQVTRKVEVSTGVVHQSRSGSAVLGLGAFKSNMVTLNASLVF